MNAETDHRYGPALRRYPWRFIYFLEGRIGKCMNVLEAPFTIMHTGGVEGGHIVRQPALRHF